MTRPIGIKLLMIYLFIMSLLYVMNIIFGINYPLAMLFGNMMNSNFVMFLNFVIVICAVAIIYGFYYRKPWAFEFSIAFFSLSILSSLVSMFYMNQITLNVVRILSFVTFLSIIIINAFIILYVYFEKDYFKEVSYHGRELQYRDKVFVYTLFIIWGLLIATASFIGISFYQRMVGHTNSVVSDLMKKDQYTALDICNKKIGEERDVCYLVVVNSETLTKAESVYACDKVKSDFYRFTCYQALAGIKNA